VSEDHPQYAVVPPRELQDIYWQVVDKTLHDVFCSTDDGIPSGSSSPGETSW